jgi:hypothetical protein
LVPGFKGIEASNRSIDGIVMCSGDCGDVAMNGLQTVNGFIYEE